MSEQTETRPETARRELKQVFLGRHVASTTLTGPGSDKHTEHHAISLDGAPVSYQPGDALGVRPGNDATIVTGIIERLGATGQEIVPGPRGELVTLRHALTSGFTVSTVTRKLIELVASRGAKNLATLLEPANTARLKAYVTGRDAYDVLDVLDEHREVHIEPAELVGTLRSLLPRLYSIASSLKAHPGEVHVLVVSVKFTLRRRSRRGVASTWLNERWTPGTTAELYLQDQQKHFSLPADPATPMIMVGPGTGVAPFRAFIEERRVIGAPGRNWLFFGEQRRASDFFYETEFTTYVREGLLRLDTAFSRDQAQKIYVQHRIREQARDIWSWLEDGAEFFVCGDKERMAADVDRELHRIVEAEGGRTPDQAKEYIEGLKMTKRYKRDVY